MRIRLTFLFVPKPIPAQEKLGGGLSLRSRLLRPVAMLCTVRETLLSGICPSAPLAWLRIWLRELDLNQRPSGYEPDGLSNCPTPQKLLATETGFKAITVAVCCILGRTRCKMDHSPLDVDRSRRRIRNRCRQ